MKKFGILCGPTNPSYEVLSEVAEELGEDEIEVVFTGYETPLSDEELGEYDGIFANRSKDITYISLRRAEEKGIPTFNSYKTHVMADNTIYSYYLLEKKGFRVPKWSTDEGLRGKVVKKPINQRISISPEIINVTPQSHPKSGFLHQIYKENLGWDYKLYGINRGDEKKVFGIKAPSILSDKKQDRKPIEVNDDLVEDMREIMDIFDNARALGVDMIKNEDDEMFIVDVNAAPSFRDVPEASKILSNSIKHLLNQL